MLVRAPHLAHIWLQYGHMLREVGRASEARSAYERVVALNPAVRQPHLFLVKLARAAGDRAAITRHALAAFRLDPADPSSRALLLQALSIDEPGHAELLADLADPGGGPTLANATQVAPDATLFFDVGDLIAHLAGSRLPSGLQRVEIEVTRAVFAGQHSGVALCCWSEVANGWKPLAHDSLLSLLDVAASDVDDATWRGRYASLLYSLAMAPTLAFPRGATLFNLGMAWNDALYHPAVAREKAQRGLRFTAIACDVIPLARPDEVPRDIVVACGQWLDTLADVADVIVAISAATREDIVKMSADRGRPISADRIRVVPLDATFKVTRRAGSDVLDRHRLEAGSFALYVSTIEPRKNHLAALAAWRLLLANDAASTPELVCVGRMGWRSEPVVAALAADPLLARRVHMLERVTDDDLDQLYEACAFLFYPSLQEGWGLPVTEALARGKVPVIGCNSSLPEAGGPFAVYVDATSPADMADVVARLVRDPLTIAAREHAVRDGFRPREWSDVAADITAAVSEGTGRASSRVLLS